MSTKMEFKGLPVVVEYKKGEVRPTDDPFSSGHYMYADYGYIEGTVSNEEGDELDCFVGEKDPNECDWVFLALIHNEDDTLNEIKVFLGFDDEEDVQKLLRMQYEWSGAPVKPGPILVSCLEDFKIETANQRVAWEKEQALKTTKADDNEGKEPAKAEPRPVKDTMMDVVEMMDMKTGTKTPVKLMKM